MTGLKMFLNRNARFSKEPKFFSTELRLLEWPNYPGKSLPFNLWGNDLVCLRMPRSQLKELEGVQVKLLFLIFLPLDYVVNFFQTNFFPFFLDRISKT